MRRVWVLVAVLVLFGTAAGSGSAMSPAPVVAQTTPASGLCDTAGVEQFTDIADGDYGAAYMLCMRALGLSRGMGDGSYGADDDLDRAQMASFLVRLWRDVLGNPCPTGVVSPFTDVSDDNYAAGDIECVYGLELTKGTTATTYGPWDDLEAWQITLFLYRTLNKTNNTTCAPGSGSELELATACLLQLHVVPSQTEATASTTVTRAQMGVYIVGLWHNLAGKGLPPTPPQLPTTQQSTPTTTTTTTTQPAQQTPASTITHEILDGRNSAGWVVNADGTNPQQITTEGQYPQWAPDGTKLAYYEHGSFWVVNADGTNAQQIAELEGGHTVGSPHWSPDSTRIFYTTGFPSFQLWVVNADGTNPQQISTASAENPQWSPDSTKIAYEHRGVWVVNADGTNPQQITTEGQYPQWSPDGTKVAYAARGGGGWASWAVNTDGTNAQQLTTGGVVRWSPDGTRVAYNNAEGVWVANADGSNPQQLTTNGWGPVWSPDSTKLTYRDEGIWAMNADGSNLKQITTEDRGLSHWWSPDSTRIAYSDSGGVWVADADGSNLKQVVAIQYDDRAYLMSPVYHFGNSMQWSPDSTKILLYIEVFAVEENPA